MTPPIGSQQGKIWGTTRLCFARNDTEAHCITIVKGGYCSRHSHARKWNRFYVVSGKLVVRMFQNGDDNADCTVLESGGCTDVPPRVRHEFEALEPTVAIEFYWIKELDTDDIERYGTHGGVKISLP